MSTVLPWLVALCLILVAGMVFIRLLNAELERRVKERTIALSRSNQELKILNQLITPITTDRGTAGVIESCLQHFGEVTNVKAELCLNPAASEFALRAHDDAAGSGNHSGGDIVKNDSVNRLFPIRSGNSTFGHLIVEDSTLSEADQHFLQTLAHSAGIIFKNDLLLQTIQQNNAVLNAVLESLCDAITLVDNKQEIAYANRRMATLLEIPIDRLLGSPEDYLFAVVAERLVDPQQNILTMVRQRAGIYIIKIKQRNKRECCIMLSAFPVNNIGRGYLWRDITKEQEVDRLKNDLISLVSHEFKTPITSIKGSVETLLRQDAGWNEAFKWELLNGILEDIGRLQELVSDWLEFSKINAGAIGLNREPLRPRIVVENAVKQLPKHYRSLVTVEIDVSPNLPLIYADKMRLEQVMANLLSNAIRYNDRTPQITIAAGSDDSFVNISVRDNGIGINIEHLDKVFDRFYCIDVASIRRTGGTGLGLAICRGIVEAHGGKIRAESTEGIGSVFTVSIPKYKYKRGDRREETQDINY